MAKDTREENLQEESGGRIFSDFMMDPRKKRFEVEWYSTITNKLTQGHPVTFQRLAIALGMIIGPLMLGWTLFNLRLVYQKSLLFLPFVLLVGSSIYMARQYLVRVGNSSKLGYALNYLVTGKTKGSSPDDKLRVVGYEEDNGVGVAVLDNKCRVIGYSVEGNFSKNMFDRDIIELRSRLSLLRDRLDGVIEVGVLSLENTDFQQQKDYYNSFADKSPYQHYLAKNLAYNVGADRRSEKIEKQDLFFVLRNTEDYDRVVNRHIPRLLDSQILKKAIPMTRGELENFVNSY